MGRAQVAVEPDPVRDTLDQSARRATVSVPLVAVDELVREDAGDFGRQARGWRGGDVGGDVGEREMDFFVVGVEVGLCAGLGLASSHGHSYNRPVDLDLVGGQTKKVKKRRRFNQTGIDTTVGTCMVPASHKRVEAEANETGRKQGVSVRTQRVSYPSRKSHAAHVSQDNGYGPSRRTCRVLVCWRPVQEPLDVLDGIGEERARVDGTEELDGAGMVEIADFETKLGMWKLGCISIAIVMFVILPLPLMIQILFLLRSTGRLWGRLNRNGTGGGSGGR